MVIWLNGYIVRWLIVFLIAIQPFSHSAISSVFAQTELTVTINVGDTILTLAGKTSPNASITMTEGGAVVGTTTADANGNFSKSLLAQTPGIHSIGLYSTDNNGVSTSTVTYSVSLTPLMETTISNIVLPPTISLSASEITQGETLEITGLSVSTSTITLFISSDTVTKTTTAAGNGSWSLSLDSSDLEIGEHTVTAKTITATGYQSESSEVLTFTVNPALTPTPSPTVTPGPTATPGPVVTSTLTPAAAVSPAPSPTSKSAIPSFVAIFDLDSSGRIEIAEVFTAVKSWVEEWREALKEEMMAAKEEVASGVAPAAREPKRCDLNRDRVCNLLDLSVLLYYIGR